ncbi:MAG: hypothetical protein MUC87_06895 [Bacteroidia bacterium]|nr:hypothetical protein [Bacteroidia bacterium]
MSEINSTEADLQDDDCYQLHENIVPSKTITFQFKDKSVLVHQYHYLHSGECSTDQKLFALKFARQSVLVRGENLLPLFEGIMQHLVSRVIEKQTNVQSVDNKIAVTSIEMDI